MAKTLSEEVNEHIIRNLSGSLEAHQSKKAAFHKRGLPFYTCAGNNEWLKEYPKGKIELVRRVVDLKTFDKTETIIRKNK